MEMGTSIRIKLSFLTHCQFCKMHVYFSVLVVRQAVGRAARAPVAPGEPLPSHGRTQPQVARAPAAPGVPLPYRGRAQPRAGEPRPHRPNRYPCRQCAEYQTGITGSHRAKPTSKAELFFDVCRRFCMTFFVVIISTDECSFFSRNEEVVEKINWAEHRDLEDQRLRR